MIDSKGLKADQELLLTRLLIICPPKHNFANIKVFLKEAAFKLFFLLN